MYSTIVLGCPVQNPNFDDRVREDSGAGAHEDDGDEPSDKTRTETEGSGRGHHDSKSEDTADGQTQATKNESSESTGQASDTGSRESTGEDSFAESSSESESETRGGAEHPGTDSTDTSETAETSGEIESETETETETETIGDQTCTRTLCFSLNGEVTGGAGRISGAFEYGIYIENIEPLDVIGAEIYTGLVEAPTTFSLWTSATHEGGDNRPLRELARTDWIMSPTPSWQGVDFERAIHVQEAGFWLVWDAVDGSISPLTFMGDTTAVRFRSRGAADWDEAGLSCAMVRLYCCAP